MMSGFTVDDTSTDTLNEGDGGAARISTSRVLLTAPTSTTGAVLYKTDDSAMATNLFPVGFEVDDDSTDALDEGDIGSARVRTDRVLYTSPVQMTWDSDNAANCAAITAASAQLTLDTDATEYRCCAWGNSAYALTGSNPTATTTVTTGYSFIIADGQCHHLSTGDAKIAVIGTAAAGSYCCISLEAP
jgi:hypothetical protein